MRARWSTGREWRQKGAALRKGSVSEAPGASVSIPRLTGAAESLQRLFYPLIRTPIPSPRRVLSTDSDSSHWFRLSVLEFQLVTGSPWAYTERGGSAIDAFAGTSLLYGVIREEESAIPVEPTVQQRVVAGNYDVPINGVTTRMERVCHGGV